MSRLRTPATAAGASQLRLPLEAGFKEHMGGEDQGGEGQRGGGQFPVSGGGGVG